MSGSRYILLVLFLTLYLPPVLALSLGELELKSKLGEPLNAEIPLNKTLSLSPRDIIIVLASAEDYSRFDKERSVIVTDLKFKVLENDSGGLYLEVTSTQPIKEPLFDFIIEVFWPSGKILLDYTVLLDLPIFDNRDNAPIELAISKKENANTNGSVLGKKEKIIEKLSSKKGRERTQKDYGITKSGDTLWEIALKVRTDNSISIQQTMLALQRLNPDAFINNNINLLKIGYVLRIPDALDMTQDSKLEANTLVQLQNEQFQDYKKSRLAQLDASPRERREPPIKNKYLDGKLTLLAANSSSGQRAGAGVLGIKNDTLQNELDFAREELDGARRSNNELNIRLDELNAQIETLNELIKLKDDQLAAWRLEMKNLNESVRTSLSEKEGSSGSKATASSLLNDPLFVALIFTILVCGLVIAILLAKRKTGRQSSEDEDPSDFTGGEKIDWVGDSTKPADDVSVEIAFTEDGAEQKSPEASNHNNGEPNIDEDANGKLNLARAYVDMGDQDSARPLLAAVLEEGNSEQIQEANILLDRLN
ncbi:MAG: FimV/HubP family polar landmark protein [Pseudomonadota bacterium]|nr:FimV/HubP family polar landmark protein [Pseudomonadota bacterium]